MVGGLVGPAVPGSYGSGIGTGDEYAALGHPHSVTRPRHLALDPPSAPPAPMSEGAVSFYRRSESSRAVVDGHCSPVARSPSPAGEGGGASLSIPGSSAGDEHLSTVRGGVGTARGIPSYTVPVTSNEAFEAGPDRGLERTPPPPQDLNAERGVLGGMMLSKDAIADVVETVRGNDFYRPAHEMIFEAIIDLYGRGEPADLVTVSDELSKRGELQRVGGGAYLADLIDMVPTAANAGFYAEIVVERAQLRRLVEAGTRIVQLGYAPTAARSTRSSTRPRRRSTR